MNIFTDYLASISDDQHRAKLADVLGWVSRKFPWARAENRVESADVHRPRYVYYRIQHSKITLCNLA